MPNKRRPPRFAPRPAAPTSWDALAHWYNGWVGEAGSDYHRAVAIPAVLQLLEPQPGETVLDVGAGQGALAPPVARSGAMYVGVDASPRLVGMARRHHGGAGQFLVGDAARLLSLDDIKAESFDAVVFLLSLQDMDPVEPIITAAAGALKSGGRMILLLTHPAFRIPRQSGWGIDEGRKLVYRRVDRYLTPLPVPLRPLPGQKGVTRSFHRPISTYVNAMGDSGVLIDHLEELAAHRIKAVGAGRRAEELARSEIPLFLGVRGWRVTSSRSSDPRSRRAPER